MQQSKWTIRWTNFVSLNWYDGLIEFLFRFVAKTSEPLLAAGIVYSAADILSKGHLSGNGQTFNDLWALTQAIAIESSGGVVLVYGLQSLKERDTVKAWLYLILSALLAIAGGIMLFMQLAGWEQQQNDSPFMLALFALRCVVSVGYIYLCRTKHIRFMDLAETVPTAEPVVPPVPIAVPDLEEILQRLEERYQQRMVTTIETIVERVTIPMQAASREPAIEALGTVAGTAEEDQGTDTELAEEPGTDERLLSAYRLLTTENKVTVTGLAQLAHVRKTTASKWLAEQHKEGA